jgi:hypothetical protein
MVPLQRTGTQLVLIYNAIVLMFTKIHSSIRSTLPSINSLARWFGEPVRAAILQTEVITQFF